MGYGGMEIVAWQGLPLPVTFITVMRSAEEMEGQERRRNIVVYEK